MKVQVFHDANGTILSVVEVSYDAASVPVSTEYSSVTADLAELKVCTLAEVHSRFRVDGRGRVLLRDAPYRPAADD